MNNKTLEKQKSDLREAAITKRSSLSAIFKNNASKKITREFIANAPLKPSDRIACYWPISGEVDTKMLMEILLEQKYACALPKILGKDQPLEFKQYDKTTKLLINNKFKVYEPPKSATTISPTILVVPLLAFDSLGHRLGFGGGFYDRTIESLQKKAEIMTIGLAYSSQQVPSLPRNGTDQKLDCIITERRVWIFD